MNNYEMLIDRLRSIAVKGEAQMVDCRTLHRAADALENQERVIQGLEETIKKQGSVNLQMAEMALKFDTLEAQLADEERQYNRLSDAVLDVSKELGYTKKQLGLAQEERDVVTKRMIELAIELSHALADFKLSLIGDPCAFCANCFDDDRCEESDIDCEKCRHDDCTCKGCRDFDRWVWRGVQKEGSHGKA